MKVAIKLQASYLFFTLLHFLKNKELKSFDNYQTDAVTNLIKSQGSDVGEMKKRYDSYHMNQLKPLSFVNSQFFFSSLNCECIF